MTTLQSWGNALNQHRHPELAVISSSDFEEVGETEAAKQLASSRV